jgi:light-regulated signal transduction histidine kinase (bacteriophytochrome)
MQPRQIGHERREMARHAALSLEGAIARLEEEVSHREALRLIQRREEVLPYIADAETLTEGLTRHPERLLGAIPADGVAIMVEDELVTHGVTPPAAAIRELAGQALQRSRAVHASDSISESYAAAAAWSAQASGLLSVVVSRRPATVVLWFRAEEIETVNWAGNPHAPAERAADGALCPRRSFEIWAEQVRGRSRPWRPAELDAARQLAARINEIGERKTLGELNRHLGETLESKDAALAHKDLLMREVHHRVQNNLQLVNSMLRLQEGEVEDAGSRRQLELARDRIQSISVLHRRLWRSDDLELVNIESFFAVLTDDLANAWGDEWRGHISRDVAPLRVPGPSALLLGLVVTELLSNAFKHAYEGAPGPIALSVKQRGKSRLAITVADKGIGPGAGLERPGSFGSRLIQRLVAQLSGEIAVVDDRPGTAVTLVIPLPKDENAA